MRKMTGGKITRWFCWTAVQHSIGAADPRQIRLIFKMDNVRRCRYMATLIASHRSTGTHRYRHLDPFAPAPAITPNVARLKSAPALNFKQQLTHAHATAQP